MRRLDRGGARVRDHVSDRVWARVWNRVSVRVWERVWNRVSARGVACNRFSTCREVTT